MLSFEQARQTILDHIAPLGIERISLLEAGGRVIAKDLLAPWGMPVWDNSAMDGFAVRHADCAINADGTTLRIEGYIPAGGCMEAAVAPGTAAKIMTGAPIPPGADAIVPVEETSEQNGYVTINGAVKLGDHIRFQCEDVKNGECIIPAGTVLRPAEIGMLASFNYLIVPVYRRPRIAILSTGDELVEPGIQPAAGQIVNCNSFAVAAALREIGAQPLLLGIARDNLASHVEKMTEGLKADALITSAGVSAGDRDLVREVLEQLGVKPVFWKVDIKPGKPTAFARNGDKPVFSLPGNPVSTMITFEELVKPALLKMMGFPRVIKPTVKATLLEEAKKRAGRTRFLRVIVTNDNGTYTATSAGDQNTGILKTMIHANGLAILPAEPDFIAAGEQVDVHLIGDQNI
ncbi:MAG: molybdopterin molybdotransferase MoeA [Desulfuromonas sp.]|nr:molybdopterin molybdotransferase MoeA [Desulfuromonas sp.]